ncbi:DUF2306 domain-containing protein [Sphingomonas sp.]|uniref:DUF2306 domain-containing protein n=1 Tax=Sphingomonas sp. TaxID=28214 RepID=UPI001B0F5D02|nr:DUF2306 domain-containing protein [Sphingomonas sp.]MBO9711277.1 DUF2306 domain-containing protein [Sphingomonas sp.]
MATIAGTALTLRPTGSVRFLNATATLLAATVWLSAALFGLYILAFFGGFAAAGAPERWNESLPALHDPANLLSTVAIGAHFITGGILLLLGPVQLIGAIRRNTPAVHRWLGRLYVFAAAIAGAGGLTFILTKGTIGGAPMDLGFGLYGALMVACAALTYVHARARRIEIHRAWAVRLFALAVGSWLYRIEYGFWFLAVGKLGHTSQFSGWFDEVMAFFFYVPNLLVAEAWLRARLAPQGSALRFGAAVLLLAATGFVALATFFFTKFWLPGIAEGLGAVRA